MKKAFITGLFILSVLTSFSQWNWSNPTPFGYHLYNVDFPNENTGYIVGEKGLVLRTEDGGVNWEIKPSGTFRPIRLVEFTDTESGFVTSDSGFIMKTTNGGESWQELQSGTTETINDIYFINKNYGFIAGMNGQLRRTKNGGESWERASIDINSDIYSICFVNEYVGYATASMYTLYKTIDGGDSWTSTSDSPSQVLESIFFLNENTGYISGSGNYMMKTTDGGNSWNHFISNRGVESMFFVNDSTGYGLKFGNLLKTENGGITWYPFGSTYCLSFDFTNQNTCYCVGYDGYLKKSEDAGVTFLSYISSVTDANLYDIHFPDVNTGYSIGMYGPSREYGVILKTNNAGNTWQVILDAESEQLSSVFFTDANTEYIASDKGNIFKTTNGGSTWDTLSTNTDSWFHSIRFIDDNIGFVGGGRDGILKTTDAGITWNPILQTCFQNLDQFQFIDENTGYALLTGIDFLPPNSSIIKTEDGGLSWTLTNPVGDVRLLNIFFVNKKIGFASGFRENIYKTIDGGDNWIMIPFADRCCNIYFTDEYTGYLLSAWNDLFQSTDGGINWTKTEYISFPSGGVIFFPDNHTGFIAGASGKILKTTNGGIVSSENLKMPATIFKLFPNPATTTITIVKSDNTNRSSVNISILNSCGVQVMKRNNQNMPVILDVNSLVPGIYLIRIESSAAIEIMKLVKI